MDLENDELDITKLRRKKIHYTKLVANNKGLTAEQFKEFYQDYCELYDIMCDYMSKYNEIEKEVTHKDLANMILGMLE